MLDETPYEIHSLYRYRYYCSQFLDILINTVSENRYQDGTFCIIIVTLALWCPLEQL